MKKTPADGRFPESTHGSVAEDVAFFGGIILEVVGAWLEVGVRNASFDHR